MRLFPDSPKTYYEEVLRTVGAFAEGKDFRDLRVIETEDGLIVQGRVPLPTSQGGGVASESYLLTVEDLQALMRDAYDKRGSIGTDLGERSVLR